MNNQNLSRLLRRRVIFDDKKIDQSSQKEGIVKVRYETKTGKAPEQPNSRMYARLHKKGRIMAFYVDVPLKTDSVPFYIAFMNEIRDLQEGGKNKTEFIKIVLQDEQIECKFEEAKEFGEWIKVLRYFKGLYGKERQVKKFNNKGELDLELKLQLMAENELDEWDTIKNRYDFSAFFKDKGLLEFFGTNSLPVIANRILISTAKEGREGKNTAKGKSPAPTAPAKSTDGNRPSDNAKLNNRTSTKLEDKSRGTVTLQDIKKELGFVDQNANLASYTLLLISQQPIGEIDEEELTNDIRNISSAGFPAEVKFNVLYFFEYSKAGDQSPPKISIPIK